MPPPANGIARCDLFLARRAYCNAHRTGALFVLLSTAVLLHRAGGEWLERLFFPFGAVTGGTAYAMSYWAVGGWVERSAVRTFNLVPVLTGPCLLVSPSRSALVNAGVNDAPRGYPARYRNDSYRDSNIHRHQFSLASWL